MLGKWDQATGPEMGGYTPLKVGTHGNLWSKTVYIRLLPRFENSLICPWPAARIECNGN